MVPSGENSRPLTLTRKGSCWVVPSAARRVSVFRSGPSTGTAAKAGPAGRTTGPAARSPTTAAIAATGRRRRRRMSELHRAGEVRRVHGVVPHLLVRPGADLPQLDDELPAVGG